jgi:hypothetical protein
MNWSEDQLREHYSRLKGGDTPCQTKISHSPASNDAPPKSPGGAHPPIMNKTEIEYAQQLELQRLVGDILYWEFEKIKIRIGYRCWLNVDFFIQFADGHFEVHDTKGAQKRKNGKTYRAEDDAIVKARALGSKQFPIPIYFVHKGDNGEWQKIAM